MSGIYIPGLSMPRKTGIVSIVLSGDGSALLCEDGAYSEIKVIPVPDHGRLIDADALMQIIREHDYPLKAHFNSTDNGMFTIGIQQAVDETPTIIPAEEGEE